MMKNRAFLLTIFLLSAALLTQAQNDPGKFIYIPEKVSKKAVNLYTRALSAAEADDLKGAIALLKQATQVDDKYEEAWLSIAGMYGELKNYPEAITNYEKARSIDSSFFI